MFYNFLNGLISCPTHLEFIERVFSTFGLSWQKLHSWPSSEKVKKLVKVQRYLSNNNELKEYVDEFVSDLEI